MVDSEMSSLPNVIPSDSFFSTILIGNDESIKTQKPMFVFSDASSESSTEDLELEEKQYHGQTLTPEVPDLIREKHSLLLNQLLSSKGEVVKSRSGSNETSAIRPLQGSTLFIAKCNVDVSVTRRVWRSKSQINAVQTTVYL